MLATERTSGAGAAERRVIAHEQEREHAERRGDGDQVEHHGDRRQEQRAQDEHQAEVGDQGDHEYEQRQAARGDLVVLHLLAGAAPGRGLQPGLVLEPARLFLHPLDQRRRLGAVRRDVREDRDAAHLAAALVGVDEEARRVVVEGAGAVQRGHLRVAGLEEAGRLLVELVDRSQLLERPSPVPHLVGPQRSDALPLLEARFERRRLVVAGGEPAGQLARSRADAREAAAQLLRARRQPIEPALEPARARLQLHQPGLEPPGTGRQLARPGGGFAGPRRDAGRAVGRLAGLGRRLADRSRQAVVAGGHRAATERVAAGGRAQRSAHLAQRLREQRVGLADRHPVERVPGRLGLALGDLGGLAQQVEARLPAAELGGQPVRARRELGVQTVAE